jgi:hypothetical protein
MCSRFDGSVVSRLWREECELRPRSCSFLSFNHQQYSDEHHRLVYEDAIIHPRDEALLSRPLWAWLEPMGRVPGLMGCCAPMLSPGIRRSLVESLSEFN